MSVCCPVWYGYLIYLFCCVVWFVVFFFFVFLLWSVIYLFTYLSLLSLFDCVLMFLEYLKIPIKNNIY